MKILIPFEEKKSPLLKHKHYMISQMKKDQMIHKVDLFLRLPIDIKGLWIITMLMWVPGH